VEPVFHFLEGRDCNPTGGPLPAFPSGNLSQGKDRRG
jgi:hypothetical protein